MNANLFQKIKGGLHFRDIFTSILLLISFSLCFLLMFNGLNIMHKISIANKAKTSNTYLETITMECIPFEGWRAVRKEIDPIHIINSLDVKKGNVELKYGDFQSGSTFTNRTASVFLKWTEDIPAALKSGRYPNKEEIKDEKLVTIIGNGMIEYTEVIEGVMCLKVGGEWYQVIGILEDDTASNVDERIFLFFDCMNDTMRYELMVNLIGQHPYSLQYKTNQINTDESVNAFFEWIDTSLDAEYREVTEAEIDTSNGIGHFLTGLNQWIVRILLVFGLINCIVISNIWIKRRKKEFAIRKALGGSMFHIGKLVFVEFIQLSIGSMCITFILQVIYSILNKSTSFHEYVFQDIMYLFLGMLGCVTATLLIPMVHIARINPVQEIRK